MSTNKSFSSETSERYSRALFGVASDSNEIDKIENELKKNRVLFVPAAENVLRLLPPLTVKKEEIELAIEAIRNEATRRTGKTSDDKYPSTSLGPHKY